MPRAKCQAKRPALRYGALAAKLFATLEREVSAASAADRVVLAALVAKSQDSLALVAPSLCAAIVQVRGIARLLGANAGPSQVPTLPGAPLVYATLDLEGWATAAPLPLECFLGL